MKVAWSDQAREQIMRFVRDQDGMRQIMAAIDGLLDDPAPREAFVRGDYRRLRVGPYRVMYKVIDDRVMIDYVGRVGD